MHTCNSPASELSILKYFCIWVSTPAIVNLKYYFILIQYHLNVTNYLISEKLGTLNNYPMQLQSSYMLPRYFYRNYKVCIYHFVGSLISNEQQSTTS